MVAARQGAWGARTMRATAATAGLSGKGGNVINDTISRYKEDMKIGGSYKKTIFDVLFTIFFSLLPTHGNDPRVDMRILAYTFHKKNN